MHLFHVYIFKVYYIALKANTLSYVKPDVANGKGRFIMTPGLRQYIAGNTAANYYRYPIRCCIHLTLVHQTDSVIIPWADMDQGLKLALYEKAARHNVFILDLTFVVSKCL